jgi:hypothetical protein
MSKNTDLFILAAVRTWNLNFKQPGIVAATVIFIRSRGNSVSTGWTTGRSRFDPRQMQRIFPLASVSRPALRPTQPPVQWVPGVLSPGAKRGPDMTLTTHPNHCKVREWVGAIYLSPLRLHMCVVGLLYIYCYFVLLLHGCYLLDLISFFLLQFNWYLHVIWLSSCNCYCRYCYCISAYLPGGPRMDFTMSRWSSF